MNRNPSVNRYFHDKAIDRIDHALGRPLFPLLETNRNHYAVGVTDLLVIEFSFSADWQRLGEQGTIAFFAVSDAGRRTLDRHLAGLAEPWLGFEISYEGHSWIEAAKSAAQAKYAAFLGLRDSDSELTFGQFCAAVRCRKIR